MALLQQAQNAYDTQLISDPSWVRPLIPETYYVDVPYTIDVPYTVQESTTTRVSSIIQVPETNQVAITSQVERTIQVPHTETVTVINQVPRTVATIIPGGLTAKSYNMLGYNASPPLPSEDRLVSTQTVPNISFNWGSGQILNSGLSEDVIVNFSGNINIPSDGTYGFYSPADDGTILIIDGVTIANDWRDKGGGGSTVTKYLTAGNHSITLWYYENGGGANVWLYWMPPGTSNWQIVPDSAFGQQTVATTVYDEVATTQDITTYTTEIVYDEVTTYMDVVTYNDVTIYEDVVTYADVTYYNQETRYRREERTRMIPDASASAPLINNSDLLSPIASAQTALSVAQSNLAFASQAVSSAESAYNSSVIIQQEKSGIIESTSQDVNTKQQELNVAQQELEAIPPFREPTPTPTPSESTSQEPAQDVVQSTPKPEPSTTPETYTEPKLSVDPANIAPQELSTAEVVQLINEANAVLATAQEGSPEYNKALDALFVAAQADDIQVPENLANIPGVGQAAVAAIAAINFMGNVGSDMAPATREKAKKEVVAAVVATGAAVSATAMASSSSPSGGSGGSSGGNSSGNEKTETNKPNRRETR